MSALVLPLKNLCNFQRFFFKPCVHRHILHPVHFYTLGTNLLLACIFGHVNSFLRIYTLKQICTWEQICSALKVVQICCIRVGNLQLGVFWSYECNFLLNGPILKEIAFFPLLYNSFNKNRVLKIMIINESLMNKTINFG